MPEASSKTTIVVHNGKFHADDVFAAATLRNLLGNRNVEIIRTRDEEWFKKGDYVADVGGIYNPAQNRFDHHQPEGAGKRASGIPYASFGLVWQKFGGEVCGSPEAADYLDKKIVQYIDAIDNGVDVVNQIYSDVPIYDIKDVVRLFQPAWKTQERDVDLEFLGAVEWAQKTLKLEIEAALYVLEAKKVIENRYNQTEDKRLIIFDGKEESLGGETASHKLSEYPEPIYSVSFKSDPENWKIIAINKNEGTFELRKPLPKEWGGLSGKELETATGVPGALFCHRGRFMCTANSKEAILKLAQIALESQPN